MNVRRTVVLLLPLAVACGGGGSPTVPPTSPPITQPPAPAPTPTPAPLGCGAPASTATGVCVRTSARYLADVDAAIDRVVTKQPALFDLSDQRGPGGYRVRDTAAYFRAVVDELVAAGFCATADGGEVAVKRTNDFNEQFAILLSSEHVRRGDASYRATCTPAWF